MADRPILFSAPMVCALLEGRKTQTRRVLTTNNTHFDGGRWPNYMSNDAFLWRDAWVDAGPSPAGNPGPYLKLPVVNIAMEEGSDEQTVHRIYPKIQPGNRLWVREHWRTSRAYDDLSPSEMGGEEPVKYEADGTEQMWGWSHLFLPGRFRQGMHMPRWVSRLTLIVTDVRVQRLQEISEADAVAEGGMFHDGRPTGHHGWRHDYSDVWPTARDSFRALWRTINGPDAWDASPWVVALTFSVHRCNIDQMEAEHG
jgi:hypothetical protein